MVAKRPGEISALTKFKSEFGLKRLDLEISGLKNLNLRKKKSNLPPHPQKAWLNPCLASSREIAGQTEKGEFVYFTKMYIKDFCISQRCILRRKKIVEANWLSGRL